MTKRDVELFAMMLEWSKEVGLDHKQLIKPDGSISFLEWWEKIISCMTLDEVGFYLDTPELPGAKENSAVQRMRSLAIAHRDRLLAAVEKGAGVHAKSERYAG